MTPRFLPFLRIDTDAIFVAVGDEPCGVTMNESAVAVTPFRALHVLPLGRGFMLSDGVMHEEVLTVVWNPCGRDPGELVSFVATWFCPGNPAEVVTVTVPEARLEAAVNSAIAMLLGL